MSLHSLQSRLFQVITDLRCHFRLKHIRLKESNLILLQTTAALIYSYHRNHHYHQLSTYTKAQAMSQISTLFLTYRVLQLTEAIPTDCTYGTQTQQQQAVHLLSRISDVSEKITILMLYMTQQRQLISEKL